MVKIRRRLGVAIIVLLLVTVSVLVLALIACDSSQDVINPPPSDSVDKGNPKLDSPLNQLFSADKRGEAALFAEQSNIELINNGVRVILECRPGQLEEATQTASNAGAKLEASYENLLQVVVPITKLSALADAASIHFIRLPQKPLPAVGLHG